jgi:hypothetical protein
MKRLPGELSDVLTPRGRRLLARPPGPRPRFQVLGGLVDRQKASDLRQALHRGLFELLSPMEDPIPAWTTQAMRENYSEVLPKTVRVRTALLDSRRAKAYRKADALGLIRLLRSQSFHAFAQALAGEPLQPAWGIQALCYGPGDYAGPHNDHHPEEPEARDGYFDVHLSLSGPGVAHQWLVYERDGHLSELASVNTLGGVTAYRLPFWHYTTPLQAKPGRADDAYRWVLLGTFTYARTRRA